MRHLMILGLCVFGAACDGQRSSSMTSPSTSAAFPATQSQSLQAGGPPVEITFTKWIPNYPLMVGVTGGDVPGVYAGEVLSRVAFDNGVIVKLRARYEVDGAGSDHDFKAVIEGTQNQQTGTAMLNGVVTEGWLTGAQVHVTFQRTSSCAEFLTGPCFQGTIRVMAGSAE